MPGLDTNVLVRWLVADDEAQLRRVHRLLKSAVDADESLLVPCTVTLELEWVLRSRYRFDKSTVLQVFNALLETRELQFQSEDAIERALHLYREGMADFADCLHVGLCAAAGCEPMFTFDEKAARLAQASLVKA